VTGRGWRAGLALAAFASVAAASTAAAARQEPASGRNEPETSPAVVHHVGVAVHPELARPHRAEPAAAPVGEPVLDPPTLRCLGFYWIGRESDVRPATVDVAYRKAGMRAWKQGPPLFRVERGPFKDEGGRPKPLAVAVPAGARLFAGSLLLLDPDTAYEVRLTLHSGSDAPTERVLHARTIAEPALPAGMAERHVVPGKGGGDGTRANPFRGLESAERSARPGDLFLLHAGVYDAPFYVRHSGEPDRPIVWRGAGDGDAVIDAKRPHDNLTGHAIEARGIHDVWFERLSICNAYSAICGHESSRLVVRRCHMYGVLSGFFATRDETGKLGGFFVADNVVEGIMPWPATDKQWHDLPESRGIWISGRGSVVCYNRISHCKDGMDLDDCRACVANDFHNNDVSEVFDDGSEMDGSDRNTRNFLNRYTNVLCGISFQPVYGGPVYAFRNTIYNIRNEPFKLHNSPSGAVIVHNTTARAGGALRVSTSDAFSNCCSRNNLFVGTAERAFDCSAPAIGCDFDYDGFAGWSGDVFIKWNGEKYATPADVRARCPIERHVRALDPAALFVGGTQAPANELTVYDRARIDLRLSPRSPAIDAGVALPGFDDGFRGAAPDLGAYEAGADLPHYGPRPDR
jgi:hypothetical protein